MKKKIKITSFWRIDDNNSKVDRRNPCEWCGKRLCRTKLRRRRNGWSKLTIQWNSTQNHRNWTIFGHKKLTIDNKFWKLKLLDAAQVWKTLSMWFQNNKWDSEMVRKMLWHGPYTIGHQFWTWDNVGRRNGRKLIKIVPLLVNPSPNLITHIALGCVKPFTSFADINVWQLAPHSWGLC